MSNLAFDLIGLTRLRNDPAYAGIDGSGIGVVVIDTGVDATHSLLSGNVVQRLDFMRSQNHPSYNLDENSHGTHVSGTIGATDPDIGIATDVDLIGLKIGGLEGSPSISGVAVEAALQWVLQNRQRYNIQVVNMSLGGGFYTSSDDPRLVGHLYLDDVQALIAAGVTVVSAAGNEYDQNRQPGSSAPGIFSALNVGAVYDENEGPQGEDRTTDGDRLVYFSHRPNTSNTIFAPGAYITSTIPGNRFADYPGTSMASPHVAGAVALIQEAAFSFGGRYLLPSEVRDLLIQTADTVFDGDDEDTTVPVTNSSYPRLNVYNAVQAVRNLFNGGGGNAIDPNGTIASAFIISPALDGSETLTFSSVIGVDGASLTDGSGGVQVGGKDVDLFRFEMAVAATVTIETAQRGETVTDTVLRLFDQNGNPLAINDDKSDGDPFSTIQFNLQPGVYYAGVSGFDNSVYNPNAAGSGVAGSTGNYNLALSLTAGDPNGLQGGAVRLNVNQEPEIRLGVIGTDGGQVNADTGEISGGTQIGGVDVDLFEVIVPDNGRLFIDIDTPAGLVSNLPYVDSVLRVFDENGTELILSDDGLAPDESDIGNDETEGDDGNLGHTTDSYVSGTVTRGQRLYIGVSDWRNADYSIANTADRDDSGVGGYFQLYVNFQNNDLNGAISQASGDWFIPLDEGVQYRQGNIGFDGSEDNVVGDRDVDFSQVRSATGGILEVEIDSTAPDPNSELFNQFPDLLDRLQQDSVDTVVQLWDADGNLLATVDDTQAQDPTLRYQIQPNVDYYISRSGYGNDEFDPFRLGSGAPGDTGFYGMKVQLRESSDAAILTDNRIGNTAIQNITLGQSVQDKIGFDESFFTGASDIDLYRLQLAQGQPIEIRTTSPSNFSADTVLRLFDSSGAEIAFNDNLSDRTGDSLIQANLVAGTYFIGVNGASSQARSYNPFTGAGVAPGSQGDYVLAVTQPTATPTPSPTPSPAPTPSPTPTPNLVLRGTSRKDILIGGDGNDQITGGRGRDRLTGGGGADRFYFRNRQDSGDRITDFAAADSLLVSTKGFQGLKVGALKRNQFHQGTKARDASDRFIFNRRTGALFFDQDGIGSVKQLQLVQLSSGTNLNHRDIVVF